MYRKLFPAAPSPLFSGPKTIEEHVDAIVNESRMDSIGRASIGNASIGRASIGRASIVAQGVSEPMKSAEPMMKSIKTISSDMNGMSIKNEMIDSNETISETLTV
jgi:hypothetical protein